MGGKLAFCSSMILPDTCGYQRVPASYHTTLIQAGQTGQMAPYEQSTEYG
jgi:hypothetical protein